MAYLAENTIRFTYFDRYDKSRTIESMIDSGVFHIFLLAGRKWDIKMDQITEDFKNFVVFHEIPPYVTGSIHGANRVNQAGLEL